MAVIDSRQLMFSESESVDLKNLVLKIKTSYSAFFEMPTEEQGVEDTGLKHLLLALKAQDTTIESDLLLEIISYIKTHESDETIDRCALRNYFDFEKIRQLEKMFSYLGVSEPQDLYNLQKLYKIIKIASQVIGSATDPSHLILLMAVSDQDQ